MTRYLILHGTGASPNSNWFMWLKGVLIGRGQQVWLPQLPDANQPNVKTYTKFLRANKDFKLDKDTVIIGHSSGAVEILYLLQHLPLRTRLKAVVLVSAFTDNLGRDDLTDLFPEPFDFEKIKARCSNITLIHSEDDPYVPLSQAEQLALKLEARLVIYEEEGHFNTELGPKYKQFPELLEILDQLDTIA